MRGDLLSAVETSAVDTARKVRAVACEPPRTVNNESEYAEEVFIFPRVLEANAKARPQNPPAFRDEKNEICRGGQTRTAAF